MENRREKPKYQSKKSKICAIKVPERERTEKMGRVNVKRRHNFTELKDTSLQI